MEPALASDQAGFEPAQQLAGLSVSTLSGIQERREGYTEERLTRFLRFQARLKRDLLTHRVITNNQYTAWFRLGQQSEAQLRDFIVQFSVFSNLFLQAQLQKMINADTLEGMRASKEILANEIGVSFNSGATSPDAADPESLGTEGTVQGGVFRFEAGHFEWLCQIASRLGLKFGDLGRRRLGSPATLFFCDELMRLYGSEHYAISQAASYAVENWAAAGFWDELVEGLQRYGKARGVQLPLGFFVWHRRLEAQHARHTQEELEEYFFRNRLDEDAFISFGNQMLNAVAAFWDGLDRSRRQLAARDVS
jgi:hypothetical protein